MKRSNLKQLALCGAMVAAILSGSVQAQTAVQTSAASAPSAKDAKAANRKLQRNIVKVLARTKGLVSSAIAVRAKDGDVILEGAVPEESQMTLATKATEGVPGVKSVKNMLTLSQF
ncbi:putative periplasmic or secreted lipoprotein [Candidatus Burkholderia verschuerenii]|uniref:Putative periplasmic or secreted lipoprotein n=1 Tax=Candidatus Burkholderia verschuerenii TaxID=242163 RepID=A0A0L0MG61_9BURK|nr:BON domain-containing protein [Candidatus Burkholderia verschuerenii]KND61313.1 putative periplasmic or secreted lipoprotein [Candidatus Burkholderia verschuerenii]